MDETETFSVAQNPFASDRWAMIITLLSMDVVIAFDDLMGLVVPNRLAFLAVLRSLILDMRSGYAGGGPFYSPTAVEAAFASELGEERRDHVAWWGNQIFERDRQDHRDLYAWTLTLRHCRHDPSRWESLGLPGDVSRSALSEFLRSINTTEYNQRKKQAQARPLSDWDLHMYALNRFDDDEDISSSGPWTYLYPTVMAYEGYRFWAWLLERLNIDQQAAFREGASLVAKNTRSLVSLGPLPPPNSLWVRP